MIKTRKKRQPEEVNSSSMADIAFLLLIFFLVTTTISNDQGINYILPKKLEDEIEEVKFKPRNLYKVLLNSQNQILVGSDIITVADLKDRTKKFVNNRGRNPEWSETPEKAIVSFKTDRGTDFKTYIAVLDQLKAAYNELRAEHLDVSVDAYLKLDPAEPEDNEMLQEALKAYPPTLSEAEPTDFSK